MPLTSDQVNQITHNLHSNPQDILGCHPEGKRWSIRAYLPTAKRINAIVNGQAIPMRSVYDPNFFICNINQAEKPRYQLQIDSAAELPITQEDPYNFQYSNFTAEDLNLFAAGEHPRIYQKMGAHPVTVHGIPGINFAVWAPNARNISIIGNFNKWDGRTHQMSQISNGIWELFIPHLAIGEIYKFEIKNSEGHIYAKADPYAFYGEVRPNNASIVVDLDQYPWQDQTWLAQRRDRNSLTQPISVYEVHLGSWMNLPITEPVKSLSGKVAPVAINELKPSDRYLTYYELADKLIHYVKTTGYTHIELLPIAEHPFDGSWGYQVTGYYAPTSRYGRPEDLMYLIDRCHQENIGVIVDWVPGHFPKDAFGLAYFDGTFLYEHADPKKGEHKEWGTLVFNYGRNEVRNFLLANVLFWFDKYHIDGIRVDAVASMLYLNYNRKDGEWIPNEKGTNENFEAVDFMQTANTLLFKYYPGALSIAEESTAWSMVSRPAKDGGLGFNYKWNMGWMHDVLDYFAMDPWFRQYHQNNVTFGMWYHHNENFMLAFSHDEVVHGKSSMIGKMPGDEWQKFANLRCLFGYMFTHPGKKTMFMGMEFGQWDEWNVWGQLQWQLLEYKVHKQHKFFIQDLNRLYREEAALYEADFIESGFQWIDCSDHAHSVIAFIRRAQDPDNYVVVVCNFTPQPHSHYRIGVPELGFYREIFNSDARLYGGSGIKNSLGKWSEPWEFHGFKYSLDLSLPPLGVLVFKIDRHQQPIAPSPAIELTDDENESP
ncbi:MAG: 1,4-alpha-glucan branching protein GlgB [Synechococcaceae cyanobacterium RL_1_2]|nr:1,4-alpha-glucan branching protein GlgB [Synechococcaceae cyanobacterium RL_1_2]